jgi:hypothetical protein
MAQGGIVSGNLLECQFHAWKWEGDGSCREIPYAKNIPPQAKRKDCVPSWPVAECNGFVHVWHHPEKAEPEWECVVFEEVGKPDWSPFQKFEWKPYCSMEQLSNQAVDTAHFRLVHGTQNVPGGDFEFDGITKRSVSYPKLETPRGVVNGQIASIGHGPGQGLTRFSGICETIQLSAIMPIERDVLLVRFAL